MSPWLKIATICALCMLARTTLGSEVVLKIVPEELNFETQEKMRAVVILRNGSKSPLNDIRLTWLAPNSFEVTAEAKPQSVLKAGSDAAWQLSVRQASDTTGTEKVLVRIDYSVAKDTASTEHIITDSFSVSAPTRPAAESLLAVTVDTTIVSLTQQTPGRLYISMTNKSNHPIKLGKIASRQEFITPKPVFTPMEIGVRETSVAVFDLETTKTVRPGKYLFVADIPFTWTQGTRSFSATAVAKKEIAVGVFGESEILKLMAIPSFLVLPGFLVLVTCGLLWNLGLFRENGANKAFILKANTPEFWLVAITISMAVAFVYIHFEWGNNYLERYELADVIKVWLISIFGFGLIGYSLVMLVIKWVKLTLAKRAQKLILSIGDDRMEVLEKLDRINVGLYPDRVKIKETGAFAYVYQPQTAGQTTLIIGPKLKLTWHDSADTDLRTTIDQILNAQPQDAATQIAAVLRAVDPSNFDLRWGREGKLSGLTSVATDKVEPAPPAGRIPILEIS